MGLDISVYTDLKFVQSDDDADDYAYDNYIHLYLNPYFSAHAGSLKPGFYAGESPFGFCAGSYGSYSHWREWLSEMALKVSPKAVWEYPDKYQGEPFYEIIDFSDCEGFIGPEMACKLTGDFATYEDKAAEYGYGPYDYLFKTYQNFYKAFDLAASRNGAVVFH